MKIDQNFVLGNIMAMSRWKSSEAILICDTLSFEKFKDTMERFCGKVFGVADTKLPRDKHIKTNVCVYVVASRLKECLEHAPLSHVHNINVIRESITTGEEEKLVQLYVGLARVLSVCIYELPILIHDAGVFWRMAFPSRIDYFQNINVEHKAQELTLHSNPNMAHRTGFYATEVKKINETDEDDDAVSFRLLRCSSNFTGSTNNFQTTDKFIFERANRATHTVFPRHASLNHVLAQIYHNTKDTKAKIAQHSDKTKDMNKAQLNADMTVKEGGGLIAFATFYQLPFPSTLKQNPNDPLDLVYKHTKVSPDMPGAFTKLHFMRKKDANPNLVPSFDIPLYNNSMFVIDLETNRNYTHEIVPSILPSETIPVRCGYVMRCSDVQGIHKNGQTYYEFSKGNFKQLEALTTQKARDLKEIYSKENTSADVVTYPDVNFSFNAGDYKRPLL